MFPQKIIVSGMPDSAKGRGTLLIILLNNALAIAETSKSSSQPVL